MQVKTLEIVLSLGLLLSISALIFLYVRFNKLMGIFRDLTKNVRGGNLEEILQKQLTNIAANDKKISKIDQKLHEFMDTSRSHFQKIGFKRFNPFHETGGDQSFILVLLDKNQDGFILSSLHQRDVTRVYAKLIKDGECKNKLSKEEEDVLRGTLQK